MAVDLRAIFAYWDSIGVFDIVLPFFLVFSIAYSIFNTTQVLKDKKINGIISAVIAILFVQNTYLVGLLQRFIPNVAMLVIVILMFFLIAGTFLGAKADSKTFGIVGVAALIFVIWALTSQSGYYSGYNVGYYFDDQTIATLVLVAIFVGVIWFVTKPPASGNKLAAGVEKFFKDLWGK